MPLVKAEIVVGEEKIPVMFNPSEYKISKQVNYRKSDGITANSRHFAHKNGEPKTLSLELFFDMDRGYDFAMENYNEGVREYTDKIIRLTNCEDNKKPPLCKFIWGNLIFAGYVTSVDVSFNRFNSQGVPIRAVVNLSMIEYIPDSKPKNIKVGNNNKNVVNNIEDLYDMVDNPVEWKEMAKKLGILNPRKII